MTSQEESTHPEERASIFSNFLVNWITPLINLATKRQLKDEDVWASPKNETVVVQTDLIWKNWLKEKDIAQRENRKPRFEFAVLRAFKSDIITGGIFQFMFMSFQLGQPYLVGQLGLCCITFFLKSILF